MDVGEETAVKLIEVGEEATVELVAQECCDYCGEIVHHHFDCPVCGRKYAGTGICSGLREYLEDETIFECDSCGAEFQILDPESAQAFEEIKVKCVVGKVKIETRRIDASL